MLLLEELAGIADKQSSDGLKPIVSFVEKPLLFKIFVCPNRPVEDVCRNFINALLHHEVFRSSAMQ